jgi:hypothetical protein
MTTLADLHRRYPHASTLSRQLNRPDHVDGRPVGPLLELRRQPTPQPTQADPLLVIAAGWRR